MKALVTGGGGFLGRWIVEKLRRRGDEVRVLGRRSYPDLAALGVETVQADLADRPKVEEACRGVDVVYHAAALTGIWGNRSVYHATNVAGTRNVLAGCRAHGVPRLVYTSTPSVVYGDTPIEKGDETLPYPARYLAVYPETKAEAERIVLAASGHGSMSTCALRPHLIWGPGDTNLLPRLAARSRSGKLRRVGDGTNRISVSYVENVADAHLKACDRLAPGSPVAGQCYFINEPEPVNCWEFIGTLLSTLDCPPVTRAIPLAAAYRLGAVIEALYRVLHLRREPPMTRFLSLQLATSHWFDISRARRDLQWEPAVGIDEGLRRLREDYLAAGDGHRDLSAPPS